MHQPSFSKTDQCKGNYNCLHCLKVRICNETEVILKINVKWDICNTLNNTDKIKKENKIKVIDSFLFLLLQLLVFSVLCHQANLVLFTNKLYNTMNSINIVLFCFKKHMKYSQINRIFLKFMVFLNKNLKPPLLFIENIFVFLLRFLFCLEFYYLLFSL